MVDLGISENFAGNTGLAEILGHLLRWFVAPGADHGWPTAGDKFLR